MNLNKTLIIKLCEFIKKSAVYFNKKHLNWEPLIQLYYLQPSPIFTLSKTGIILNLNPAASKFMKKPIDELKHQALMHFISQEYIQGFIHFLKQAFHNPTPQTYELFFIIGHQKYPCLLNSVIDTQSEHLFLVVSALSNQNEQHLNLATIVYQQLDVAIIVFNANNQIISCNQAFCKLIKVKEQDILGYSIQKLKSYFPSLTQEIFAYLGQTTERVSEIPCINIHEKNTYFSLKIKTINDNNAQELLHVAILLDITHQKLTQKVLEYQAGFDDLTGLPNYRLFKKILSNEILISHHQQKKFALITLDIDYFKLINDTYGHELGDLLLMQFAKRLKKNIRSSDIVIRRGGDEFNIILKDIKKIASVKKFALSLLKKVRLDFTIQDNQINISISIGIVFFPLDANQINELIKIADEAMYVSKRQGRNTFTIWNEL
jgi:diguanylate cyclase (GGDEF)-like protein/PAS domain S-box-containing protein